MNNINTQAKNEVGELLKDLVVSPVTSDVKESISRIEDSLSKLSKEHQKNIGLSNLNTLKSKKLLEELQIKLDEVSTNIGGLEQALLKPIKNKTELIDEMLSVVKENNQKISEIIRYINSLNELLSNVNNNSLLKELENKVEDVNSRLLTLTKEYNSINDSLKEQNKVNSKSYEHIYQQNKTKFYIMLVISIINSIGLIAIAYILCK